MTWRRLQLLLCLLIAAVAVIRFLTGNLIGGLITAAIAVLLFSWTTGYPLIGRLRRGWRFVRRKSDARGGD
jgi:hypothetical protein